MNNKIRKSILLALPLAVAASSTLADDYQVTITNLTQAQSFTPVLVATHKAGYPVFMPGSPASADLEAVAEGGDISGLKATLDASDDVHETVASDGLLGPGQSVTLTLDDSRRFRYLSLVSMLIPTNDAFIGISGLKLPKKKNNPVTVAVPAYDAGTEINDELCSNIPGPVCGGAGMSVENGEGFISVHPGIHGVGDLAPGTYDWRNPAALVKIERMK
ncbi:spondin domain-containing protein [Thiolapillus sp.]